MFARRLERDRVVRRLGKQRSGCSWPWTGYKWPLQAGDKLPFPSPEQESIAVPIDFVKRGSTRYTRHDFDPSMKHAHKVIGRWSLVLLGMAAVVGLMVWLGRPADSTDLVISEIARVASNDHVQGSPTSTVVLVEYSDFQCPACAVYYPVVRQVLDHYGPRVAFVYRHFPLMQIHPHARLAAQASEAAHAQGAFWGMYDLLFQHQKEWSKEADPEDTFIGYARQLGLNTDQFRDDLDSSVTRDKIAADMRSGDRAQVNSTPTFFLNGKPLTISPTYADFQFFIDRALANVGPTATTTP